jgi:hypothetical protein
MYGLTVRWSLRECAPDIAAQLRGYVRDTSLEWFTGMPGLRFKTWGLVEGESFWGTYVWESDAARREFLEKFRAGAATAPGTKLIGCEPVAYEEFEVVAVAEGGEGFASGPGAAP